MFLHGGGTFHGFEFASAWTDKFRVIHPYHPGYGESGDDPEMNELHDYVMHYAELLDQLKHRQDQPGRLFARRMDRGEVCDRLSEPRQETGVGRPGRLP